MNSIEQRKPKRLRFLTLRNLTEKQRKLLSTASIATFLPMEAIGERGELDVSVVRDIDDLRNGYTQFFDGDVLIAKITPCFENGKGAFVSGMVQGVGFGTTELHVLTPSPELDGRFLYYVTVSQEFRKAGEAEMLGAAGQKRVPEEFVRDFRIPVLQISQQRRIAEYLDKETVELDKLVAAKERVLDLLAEQRRALITRAVTGGLNAGARIRNSSVPWLGKIPERWRVAGFTKYLRSMVDYRGKTPEKAASGVFLVTARNIKTGFIDYESSQEYVDGEAYEETMQRGKPRLGELLLTTEAPLGQAALVDREDIALAQRVIKLDYQPNVLLNEFALQWILSEPFQWQLNSFATGSTALGIKSERLHMLKNIIPPIHEQRAIVAHITAESSQLDKLCLATERTIVLLKERRTALIDSAITGQIRVR